ncbi:hypothetical protein AFLA70_127g002252, partial [Aspergillus flavus AF70]
TGHAIQETPKKVLQSLDTPKTYQCVFSNLHLPFPAELVTQSNKVCVETL